MLVLTADWSRLLTARRLSPMLLIDPVSACEKITSELERVNGFWPRLRRGNPLSSNIYDWLVTKIVCERKSGDNRNSISKLVYKYAFIV